MVAEFIKAYLKFKDQAKTLRCFLSLFPAVEVAHFHPCISAKRRPKNPPKLGHF